MRIPLPQTQAKCKLFRPTATIDKQSTCILVYSLAHSIYYLLVMVSIESFLFFIIAFSIRNGNSLYVCILCTMGIRCFLVKWSLVQVIWVLVGVYVRVFDHNEMKKWVVNCKRDHAKNRNLFHFQQSEYGKSFNKLTSIYISLHKIV